MSPRGRVSAAIALSGVLVACSSGTSGTNTRSSAATTSAPATTSSAPSPAAAATPAAFSVKHCSLLSPAAATKIVGTQNSQMAMPPLQTPGGKLLDFCDYVHVDVATASGTAAGYGVVVYPNAATAKAMVAKAVAESKTLTVQSTPFATPGLKWAVHDGVGTWNLQAGVNASLAIIGTSIGRYLVWSEGGATNSPASAEQYAIAVAKQVFAEVPS